jgi:UDPglucose 6-dehydrogenase
MTTKNIGIIGNGFVGNAIYEGLKDFYNLVVYDIDKNRSYNTFEEVDRLEHIFICVPTPMTNLGVFDLTILCNSIRDLSYGKILIIKSTITPAAARILIQDFPQHDFVFNPEFLTERTAVQDFKNQKRIVLGGDAVPASKVKNIYTRVFPTCEYILTDYKTACFIKYFCNCFFAAKVSLMNEFHQVADSEGVDWDTAIRGLLSSGWVNPMHTLVPGTDGDFGFGGKCFPKDVNAFMNYAKTVDVEPKVLSAAWEKNLEVRKNLNWLKIDGAVTDSDKKGD